MDGVEYDNIDTVFFASHLKQIRQLPSLKILLAIHVRWKLRLAAIPLLATDRDELLHMLRQHSFRIMSKIFNDHPFWIEM